MIETISIHNFKSLKNICFEAKALNLFMGINASGKSSLIQSLLLMKQNFMVQAKEIRHFILNGELVSLGTMRDLYYCYGDKDKHIQIALNGNLPSNRSFTAKVNFVYADTEADKDIADLELEITNTGEVIPIDSLAQEYISQIQYISANRLGPQQEHQFYSSKIGERSWGYSGENAVAFLAAKGDISVNSILRFPGSPDASLQTQVNCWMSLISPGTIIHAEKMLNISKAILSVSFAKGLNQFNFRPQNVGLGISYTLPIVIMLLSARPGDCLIFENPEAHLHPKGQAELGKLIALCASSGVQIFVETHSDHVVNGLRVSVKKSLIPCEKVAIAFFNRNESTSNGFYEQFTTIEDIQLDSKGELSNYPDGLLDEWGNQLMDLL